MREKRDAEWLRRLAGERGGTCLSDRYTLALDKYRWRCSEGHEWEALATSIKRGQWCPVCAGVSRHPSDWGRTLAAERSGEFLSDKYVNATTEYRWRCSEGHEWSASANRIQQGHWCPSCAGNAKRNLDWLIGLAQKMNGHCLSKEYTNSKVKYRWKCHRGHEWEALAGHIRNGHWCPLCVSYLRESKPELELRSRILSVYPDACKANPFPEKPQMELDIFIPSLKKAIEFDGEYWHKSEKAKKRDSIKNGLCIKYGIDLMRVSDTDYLKDKEYVIEKVMTFLGNNLNKIED